MAPSDDVRMAISTLAKLGDDVRVKQVAQRSMSRGRSAPRLISKTPSNTASGRSDAKMSNTEGAAGAEAKGRSSINAFRRSRRSSDRGADGRSRAARVRSRGASDAGARTSMRARPPDPRGSSIGVGVPDRVIIHPAHRIPSIDDNSQSDRARSIPAAARALDVPQGGGGA
jgi:hypothetical protein